MKILHIITHPNDDTFNGTYRLRKALLKKEIESKILVNTKIKNALLEEIHIHNSTTKTPNILNHHSKDDLLEMGKNAEEFYKNNLSYQNWCNYIIKTLENLNHERT